MVILSQDKTTAEANIKRNNFFISDLKIKNERNQNVFLCKAKLINLNFNELTVRFLQNVLQLLYKKTFKIIKFLLLKSND